MAYINVYDWKCEQVTEWLKGIECVNLFYIKALITNNHIGGQQLLNLTYTELDELGIKKIGDQEKILEAVEFLKNFHFNLERENLQFLALQVATSSTSLHRQLIYNPKSTLDTDVLSDVARTISKVKTLISWLDRYPFHGHTQYNEIRVQMLRLALELATIAQRDRFVQDPIKQITSLTEKLSKLSDYIIQDITDPMLLQPAFLDLVTLKKKESELGFYVAPSYQFIHRVTDVKYNSPAHNSGKVEDGDEIIQINYQTVVGWQYKKVLLQLQESATDVLLTLKKRPKHNNRIYGQLGLIKLPSKKRSLPYRWDNLPSPRVELINIPDLLIPTTKVTKKEVVSDTDESSSGNESDILTPTEIKLKSDKENRLFMPKPRAAVLQRRHTICGDDLINFTNIGNLVLWHERKSNKENIDSPSLRDKSISISFGLNSRPSTCLGIAENTNSYKTSLPNIINSKHKKTETIQEQDNENDDDQSSKLGVSKVVRFDSDHHDYNHDQKYICNVEDTIIETLLPIPYADEDVITEIKQPETPIKENNEKLSSAAVESPKPNPRMIYDNNSNSLVEAINTIVINREVVKRGRLDKSYSTPTYDPTETENNLPSATTIDIPPRQQTIKIPPIPPRQSSRLVSSPPTKQTQQVIGLEINDENKSKIANVVDLKPKKNVVEVPITLQQKENNNASKSYNQQLTSNEQSTKKKHSEISDILTSPKVKTLTNKKKNSLIAKRRKITLKSLGALEHSSAATIQGILYRRAKDKSEVAYWVKLYFVLMDTALYGFKNKEAQKADCVIFLSGFTVSLAKEVHSKEFAFKVYHPKKTFYLAAETSEAMTQWIDYIRRATKGPTNLDCEAKELFSETECSEDEFDTMVNKQLCTPSPLATAHEKSYSADQTPPTSKHHYHLNFGSLKKTFGRSTEGSPLDSKFLGFFSSNKSEKKSADIVPTAQFKTYRKVKEINGGLQLGATSMINSNVSDMYLSSGGIEGSSFFSCLSTDPKPPEEQPILIMEPISKINNPMNDEVKSTAKLSSKPLRKTHNFLHASNPNLLDFNFHSTVDFPTSSATNVNWDHQTSMTLLDLMLQQRAEEMKDMYNKRVDQGFERTEEKNIVKTLEKPAIPPKPSDPYIDKIQKRSLPITPDYAQSFKPDDRAILYTRSKEGQKLRDFGYELISNDEEQQKIERVPLEKSNDGKITHMLSKRKIAPLSESIKKKTGFNWIMSHDKEDNSSQTSCLGNAGSFRKMKKVTDDKSNNSKFQTTNINDLVEKDKWWLQNQKLKKSSSSNMPDFQSTSSKVMRKNSAPTSNYLTKLSFSSSNTKEKKLLGSPKLHRAIFGGNRGGIGASGSSSHNAPRYDSSHSNAKSADNEIFSPITFPKTQHQQQQQQSIQPTETLQSYHSSHQMYGDLSLPPTFKPETYSLNLLKNLKND